MKKLAVTENQVKHKTEGSESWRTGDTQWSCGIYWNGLDINSELPVMVNRTCYNRNKLPFILEVQRGCLWIAIALRGNVVVITYCEYFPGPVNHTRGPWIPAAGPCLVPSLCHLLSRCPWLTLPWSVAGETKNNVGCLLACLLPYSLCEAKIGLHQLCLLVEDHLISSDSPAPHCLPPIVGTKKKRRKSWGLEFCGSLCLHPGTCVFQISVGRSELTLSGCIPAQRGGSSPFFALPGWLKGSRAENHLPNIACGPWSLLN